MAEPWKANIQKAADVLAKTLDHKTTCPKCGGGEMRKGKAIAQTYTGISDFPGKEVVTISPGGPGRLIDCMKCSKCGHSVTPNDGNKAVDVTAAQVR